MDGQRVLDEWERLGSRRIRTNGVELRVVEHGTGPLVVFCHGFPELGLSWRHQVFAFAAAGFRTLTPDLRGYGSSSRPDRVEDYGMATLCADLVGLLDAVGAERAVFAGHDWGAALVWQLALRHPERVAAVAGLSVPATPRAAAPPISVLRRRFGDDFYLCWFQRPGVADAVLAADVRGTLLRDHVMYAGDFSGPAGPPPAWLSAAELDHLVRTFTATGFTGGLNYYRNVDRDWELSAHLAGARITPPALFIGGSGDAVLRFMPTARMAPLLADPRGTILLDGAGHWIQRERPAEVSAALIDFASAVTGRP